MEIIDNTLLVDYNMIVDTDIGLYYLLQSKYNNPNFLHVEMLKLDKPGAVIKLMSEREDYNPLKMFLKDEYKNDADKLYSDLLKSESDYINYHANMHSMYNMFLAFLSTNLINITVFCKNDCEVELINKLFEKSNKLKLDIIKYTNLEDMDISKYTSIYIKRFEDCLKFKNLFKKTIYIPSYQFNLESSYKSDLYNNLLKERMPIMDICLLIGKTNKIDIIKVY